jgi:hypothetical protein
MSDTFQKSAGAKRKTAAAPNKTHEIKPVPAPMKVASASTEAGLMMFKSCAQDGSVHVKTIARWVKRGYLTEWRPHPKSRTRRIKREVWEAFKQRWK